MPKQFFFTSLNVHCGISSTCLYAHFQFPHKTSVANVQSLENKLDANRDGMKYARDTGDCNILCHMENMADPLGVRSRFTTWRGLRTLENLQEGVYVSWWIITGAIARTLSLSQAPVCPVWSSWASNGHQSIFNGSSPSVVYILPQEGKDTALSELYDVVSYQANHGDTTLIVIRDLPNCCYKCL